MDAYAVLTEAITTKQQVIARYHDEERLFSPHALGTKRGVAHVLVYQYAAAAARGCRRAASGAASTSRS
jgi:hypothetical protein